jgi:DNA-binding transcriptional MerR regulator
MDQADESGLRISRAARAAGVNVQTLHYYERRGLIRAPARTPAGYRVYEAPAVETIRAIKRAQQLGFSLREIRELIALREGEHAPGHLLEFARCKLDQIDEKIALLGRMRDALREAVENCRCGGEAVRCDALRGFGASGDDPPEVAAEGRFP